MIGPRGQVVSRCLFGVWLVFNCPHIVLAQLSKPNAALKKKKKKRVEKIALYARRNIDLESFRPQRIAASPQRISGTALKPEVCLKGIWD